MKVVAVGRRLSLLAATIALLGSGLGVTPVLAVDPIPTTLVIAAPNTPLPDKQVNLTATIHWPDEPNLPAPAGTVNFYETTTGSRVLLGSIFLTPANYWEYPTATFAIPSGFPLGHHVVEADFVQGYVSTFADTTSDPLTIDVAKAPSTTYIGGVDTVETHHSFIVPASIGSAVLDAGEGTVSVWAVGGLSPICTSEVGAIQIECAIPSQPVGSYAYYGTYSGTTRVAASQSAPFTVTVTADLVHASGVGLSAAMIYPVKDGYYDTVTLRGTREEPISVGIKIYNGSNVLVRSATIATGSGAYGYAWNGRNSAGTILGEGKYRVVQTLKDAANTTRVVTSYVTLSKKFLHWHATSITKAGSSISSHGTAGGGTVAISTTGGYVKLRAPLAWSDWAGAGWQFVLPTGISYKSIAFRVYAKHPFTAGGYTRIGAQNFSTCAYSATGDWYESCFDAWHDVGNAYGTLAWYSTGTLSAAHRYVHVVRGSITESGGQTYVYKAQVTFSYSTLGY